MTDKHLNKWDPLLEGIDDEYIAEVSKALLENQAMHGTPNKTIGPFEKFTFPVIKRAWPTLIGKPPKPKKTPLQEFTERVAAEDDPTDDPNYVPPEPEPEDEGISIVNVQPMTQPLGGLAFYRPRYGDSNGSSSPASEWLPATPSAQKEEGEEEAEAPGEEGSVTGADRADMGRARSNRRHTRRDYR